MTWLREDTAVILKMGPFVSSTDGVTPNAGLTIAQADIQISKNGAAFAQTSNAAPTTTYDADGWYPIPLTATDTNTPGYLDVQVTMAACLPVFRHFQVVPVQMWDSYFSATAGAIPNVVAGAAGGLMVTGAANAGTTTLAALTVTGALTTGTMSVTGQLDAGNLLVDTTTALTGAVTTGAITAASASITGQLDAGNVLVDTTTVLTGAVTTGAITAASASVTGQLDAGNVLVDTTTVLTGAVSTGAVTKASETITGQLLAGTMSVTGQLDAGNVLVDTTTALTGAVTTGAITAASASITGQLDAGNVLVDTTTALTGAVTTGAVTLASEAITGALTTGSIVNNGTTTLTGAVGTGALTVTGALTATTNAIPWNAAYDAEVQSECNDALIANNLDHLCLTAVANNADMTVEVADGTIISNILTKTGNTSDYAYATDSLEGIVDNAATVANVAAAILATPANLLVTNASGQVTVGTNADKTGYTVSTVSDKTGYALSATGADLIGSASTFAQALTDAVWDESIEAAHQTSGTAGKKLDDAGGAADPLTNLVPGTYGAGTAGKVLGDYLNSSVAAVKVDTAAIKVKTDYLPSATAGTNTGLFIAGTNAATTVTGSLTTTFTGNLTGSVGSVTGMTNQTGDCYARLGAPAGASVSADIAAMKVDTAAILVDTGTTLDARIPAALVGGRMDSNVGAISTDATAADNAEAFFDGTGYAGTNNVIPTVTSVGTVTTCTTCTNLTNAPTVGDLTATMKASVNTEVDNALNTAIPGGPTADSINERMVAIDAKLPSKAYLTGTTNADGDIQMSEATGDYSGTVATVTNLTTWQSVGLKKNVEYPNFHFVMRDSTNHAPSTGKTILAYRTIDAGSEASCTNAVAETANGMYRITLSAADLNGNSIMFRFSEASCDTLYVHVKTQV